MAPPPEHEAATPDAPTDATARSEPPLEPCPDHGTMRARRPQEADSERPDGETMRSAEPSAAEGTAPEIATVARQLLGRFRRVEGRYEIEKELGRGGTGAVFRGFDTELKRPVAIKVLHPLLIDDQDAVTRFIEEAQATAQLLHRAIVPVHEVAVDENGRLFFVMKLVRGRTLAEVIALRRAGDEDTIRNFSLFRLLEAFVEVARAVQYAHERGVVHRDLKPLNIMIGEYGEVHVMDWGLAKVGAARIGKNTPLADPVRTDSGRAETVVGAVFGTPAYMSPEQAMGDMTASGALMDVYGLGATLFHLLAGRPPYEGPTNRAILDMVRRPGPPPSPLEEDPRTPRELDAICRKALAKNPAERYPSARALADDVQAFLEGRPVSACPPSIVGRAFKFARRHQAATATAALALVLGFVGAIAALVRIEMWRREAQEEHERAVEARRAADLNLGRVFAEMGRRSLLAQDGLAAEVLLAKSLTLEDRRDTRVSLLEARTRGARIVWTSRRRSGGPGVAWSRDGRFVAGTLDGGVVAVWQAHDFANYATYEGGTGVSAIAFSPDARWLAAALEDGRVAIWAVGKEPGVPPRFLEGHEGRTWDVGWSPDGRRLATAGDDGTVRIWDAGGTRELGTLRGHEATVSCVVWRPDGREVASACWDGTVRFWDPDALAETGVLRRDQGWVMSVSYAPDGKTIAAGDDQQAITIWDVGARRLRTTLRGHERAIEHLAFAPDGRSLASGSADGTVRVWDLATEREILSLRAREVEDLGIGLAWSPDGGRLLLGGFERRVHVWEAQNTVESRTLRGHERAPAGVAFAPNGRQVVSSAWDGTLRIWDVGSGVEVKMVRASDDKLELCAWGRIGRRIATGGWDKTVRIFDARTLEEVRALTGHTSWIADVSLSPDERLVASASDDKTVRVFDIDAGRERHVFEADRGGWLTVAFSPDGRRVAAAGAERLARVWDVETGKVVAEMRGHELDIEGIAWSPDGRRIATGSWDRTVRIWDAESGRELRKLEGHDGWVYALAFSPDGRELASASEDATVRVWDVEAGEEALVCPGHLGEVQCVAFSPDGQTLASASYDGTVRLWNLPAIRRVLSAPAAELVAEAEQHTGLRAADLERGAEGD